MKNKSLISDIQDNIAYNESSIDYICSTPVTEGGMDFLEKNINDVTFYEDSINDDLDDIEVLDDEDPAVLNFFGVKSLRDGKEKL